MNLRVPPKHIQQTDFRKIRKAKHDTHLVWRWYHWSDKPMLVLCYHNQSTNEQRDMAIEVKAD